MIMDKNYNFFEFYIQHYITYDNNEKRINLFPKDMITILLYY